MGLKLDAFPAAIVAGCADFLGDVHENWFHLLHAPVGFNDLQEIL